MVRWQQQPGHHAREVPAVSEPRLRPAQVLVHDSRHPTGGDAGVFRPARGWRRLCRKTRTLTLPPTPLPGAAPPGNPTVWWAARSWVVPTSVPPDGDDGTPGRERLRPATCGIDHQPDIHVMQAGHVAECRGAAQQEQHKGRRRRSCAATATAGTGAGAGVGVAVAQEGGGGVAILPPPPASLSWCSNSGEGGAGVSSDTMDNEQMLTKDGI